MQQPAFTPSPRPIALTGRSLASAAAAAFAISGFLYWFLTSEAVGATLLVTTGMTIDLLSYALAKRRALSGIRNVSTGSMTLAASPGRAE